MYFTAILQLTTIFEGKKKNYDPYILVHGCYFVFIIISNFQIKTRKKEGKKVGHEAWEIIKFAECCDTGIQIEVLKFKLFGNMQVSLIFRYYVFQGQNEL